MDSCVENQEESCPRLFVTVSLASQWDFDVKDEASNRFDMLREGGTY